MHSVLLIGLGDIAVGYDLYQREKKHCLTHAKAFAESPNFKLVGGVDVCEDRRKRFSNIYSCEIFSKIKDAMNTLDPSVVVIATPTSSHLSVLETVFEFGKPQLVLCEKPLADTLVRAKKMLQLCKENNCKLYVNFFRRVEKSVVEVKKRLVDGSIKLPAKGLLWYSKGIVNSGSHYIDMLTFLLGSVVDFKVIKKGRLFSGVDPEPDVEISFQQGHVIFSSLKAENFFHNTLELIFENGLLMFDKACASTSWQTVKEEPTLQNYRVLSESKEMLDSNFFTAQKYVVDEIALALDEKRTVLATGREALIVQNVLHKIMEEL